MSVACRNRPACAPRDDDANFIALLDMLVDGRWVIAFATCGALLAGLVFATFSNPVYQADIMVQIDGADTAAARSLLGDAYTLFDVKSTAAAETQILASHLVVSKAVDALNLVVDAAPKRFPVIGGWIARRSDGLSVPGLFGYGGYAWGREQIDVPVFDVPKRYADRRFVLTSLGAGRYRLSGPGLAGSVDGRIGKRERIAVQDGEFALHVTAIYARPGTAFELARHSRTSAISHWRASLAVQEKVKQSNVIVASVRSADPELASRVLNEIGRQYIRQNVERKSAEVARSLAFLEAQQPVLRARMLESETQLTTLRNEQGTVDLAEEAKFALARSADAATRMLDLRQKRLALLSRFTDSHPEVQAIDRQIALSERDRARADARIRQLPDLQQQVLRRMRDVKVDTDLYTALMSNMQQLRLVHAGTVGNVRFVDVAAVPEVPVGLRKPLAVVASLLAGLVAGCGAAIGRAMLFRGVADPGEIECRVGIAVQAVVPFSGAQKARDRSAGRAGRAAGRPALLAIDRPDDAAVESLRSLDVMLRFAMRDASNNIVVVAAPLAGSGTGFIAANLAAVAAMSGARVLLIDGDLRRGGLSRRFGRARATGWSEVVVGGIAPERVVCRNVVCGIDFIAAGETPNYAAARLTGGVARMRIEALAKRYDIVIVAACPVLDATDAAVFGGIAGTTLLVVRAVETRFGQIVEAARRLASSGARVGGIVFNGIDSRICRRVFGSRSGAIS